jgi:hypothetical protein
MLLLCRKAAALRLGIRHTQETSVHQWLTQPSTIQHTAAGRHRKLDGKLLEHLHSITGILKLRKKIN